MPSSHDPRCLRASSLALAACLALPSLAIAQQATWRHPDGTVHTYRLVSDSAGISWGDAHAAAAKAGGYLASITSDGENSAVAALVAPATWTRDSRGAWNGAWIGGLQTGGSEPDGGWGWCEPEASTYVSWTKGQPDDTGPITGNADRMHFGGDISYPVVTWADSPANTKLPGYVIEFSGATTIPTLGLLRQERAATEGYTIVDPMNDTRIFLIDGRGRVVHSWTSQYRPGQSTYLLPNGNLLRGGKVAYAKPPAGGNGGIVEEFDWQGNLVWSYTLASATELLHHDIARLPNGNTLMLVWDYKTAQQAIAAGRDPQSLKDGHLWPDKIIEVQPTGKTTGTVVWEWHPFDHLVQDYDATKPNYGDPSKHPELIDINYTPDGIGDWMHSNSIAYNADLDQIVISVRSFDEIWVIDHSTTTKDAAGHTGGRSGKGGDLLFRWGNPMAYRAGSVQDRRLFRQHDAHWIPKGLPGAGNLLVFNNGVNRPAGKFSTVDEIVPPVPDSRTGTYAMTGNRWDPIAPAWSYTSSYDSTYVSGSQRLPSGNTIVCLGWVGRMLEVDPKGNTQWEYTNPIATLALNQGEEPFFGPNAVFRSPRYTPDYAAFTGRSLVPAEPLELQDPVLLADGSTVRRFAKHGTSVNFTLRARNLPGQVYLVGTSGTDGLIPVDTRFVRMGVDPILEMSLYGHAPSVFVNYLGLLDAGGRATATLAIPDIAVLAGLKLYTTMFVAHPLAPTGIGLISNTVAVEIE